jgi:Outer membrane cytochrome MtrC/MtrF-like, domains II/IV
VSTIKRRPLALALLGVVLVAATVAPPMSSDPTTPTNPVAPVAKKPFSHTSHVPSPWVERKTPEEARDCRGCHRFDEEHPVSSPQNQCIACHAGKGKFEMKVEPVGWQEDLRLNRQMKRSFLHHEHAALTCRECHMPRGSSVPTHLPIPRGGATCERCHGEAVDDAAIKKFELLKGGKLTVNSSGELQVQFATRLNERLISSETPIFRHADHLDAVILEKGKESDCTACHSKTKATKAGSAGDGRFPKAACADCHRAANERGLEFAETTQKRRPVWTLGTFGHDDHYRFVDTGEKKDGVASDGAHKAIRGDSCRHCHDYAPVTDGKDDYRDFPFSKKNSHTYTSCLACHDQEAWRTKDGLHGNWSNCTKCHEINGVRMMKENRPRADVNRITHPDFAFGSHSHPYISESEGESKQDCTKCHKRLAKKRASRIEKRPFRHDTHLTKTPKDSECETCHSRVRSTEGAKTLAEGGRTYTLREANRENDPAKRKDCTKCHRGSKVVEWPEGSKREVARTKRRVVEFSHHRHLMKDVRMKGEALRCSMCHTRDSGAPTQITTVACTECHQHKAPEERLTRTGDLSSAEALSCAKCHGDRIPRTRADIVRSSVTDDRIYTTTHAAFGGFRGNQYHPLPTEKACGDCHKKRVSPAEPVVPADHFKASWSVRIHTGAKEGACYGCHWCGPKGRFDQYGKRPEDDAVRERHGADLEGFPGGSARGEIQEKN